MRDGNKINCTEVFSTHCYALDYIRQEIDRLKKLAEIEKDIITDLIENETYQYGNWKFRISYTKGRVNYKDIPELEDVDLDGYRGDPVRQRSLVSVAKEEDIKKKWEKNNSESVTDTKDKK